jgi:hypothetical protein
VLVVDELDNLLGKAPQLGNGTGGIGIGVLFGKSTEGCQVFPGWSQKLEILGLHDTPSAISAEPVAILNVSLRRLPA